VLGRRAKAEGVNANLPADELEMIGAAQPSMTDLSSRVNDSERAR
jgi:hypothetical protein